MAPRTRANKAHGVKQPPHLQCPSVICDIIVMIGVKICALRRFLCFVVSRAVEVIKYDFLSLAMAVRVQH